MHLLIPEAIINLPFLVDLDTTSLEYVFVLFPVLLICSYCGDAWSFAVSVIP